MAAPERFHLQDSPAGRPRGRHLPHDFTNFTTDDGHSFGGKYLELVPNQRIRHDDNFDDPNLPGTMITTITFTPVSVGTELQVVQEGIPDAIPAEQCHLGWQESLVLLGKLVEAEIQG